MEEMIVNFYDKVREASYEHKKCPRTMNAISAMKFVKSFSKSDQIKLAYHFHRWEWDESILGKFKGWEIAWEYADIFTAFVSKYERFKYECMEINGMTKEEFREEVIADIYNILLR